MKNETALTDKEEKIAKRCAAQYNGFLARHAKVIGWFGVVIFALGILKINGINENIKEWLRPISIFIIFYGYHLELTNIIGKLYERLTKNKPQEDR